MKNHVYLIFILFVITSYSYSNEILIPMASVFYSQLSPQGEILTNSKLLGQEIDDIQSQILTKNLTQIQRLLVQAYGTELSTKLGQNTDKVKLTKKQLSQLENTHDLLYDHMNMSSKVTPEFLVVLGDLNTQIMSYKSLAILIKMAKQSKKLYEQALSLDNTFFPAYIRLATWHYFAPKIGGGDLNISLKYLNQAENHTERSFEKFQLYMWRSQVYFRMKLLEKSKAEIQKAAELFPHHTWISRVIRLNKQGKFDQ